MMISYYKSPYIIAKVANFFMETESVTRERLIITLSVLKNADKVYDRRYIKMNIALYEKLIKYSELRELEAFKALKKLEAFM